MSDVEIIHGDCREVMRGMPAGSVDAVVTDPPFGVRSETWDDMRGQELARFCMSWLAEARRIAPELVVFCNQDHVICDLCKLLFGRVRRLVWNKPPGSQYAGGREGGLWYAYEVILHCHNRPPAEFVQPKDAEVGRLIRAARQKTGMSCGAVDIAIRGKKTGLCYRWEEGACLPTPEQVGRLQTVLGLNGDFQAAVDRAYASKNETVAMVGEKHAARNFDVLTYLTVTRGRHPCEKPLGLMAELLTTIGADYKSVLDPFGGSGTTAVACRKAGRRCVIVESDPKYISVIRRRVADAATPLFDSFPA